MGSLSIREGFGMKQFMKDFKHGFKEGVMDLLWLVEEIWEMWSGHFSRAWKYFFPDDEE